MHACLRLGGIVFGIVVASAPAMAQTQTGSAERTSDVQAKAVSATADPQRSARPDAKAPAADAQGTTAPTRTERHRNVPDWLKASVQYRGRLESAAPSTLKEGPYDRYYLNRFRAQASVTARSWLKGVVEVQDSRVFDYDAGSVPRNLADSLDLFQGYVEAVARRHGSDMLARVGRQQLTLGEGRLIATADWGNTNRTYDIARAALGRGGVRIDAFGGAAVQVNPDGLNDHAPGERFYGGYGSLTRLLPRTVVEPYAIVKTAGTASGELGSTGDASIHTYGARTVVRPTKTTEVAVEAAVQRGHQAADDVRAWAEHVLVSWSPGGAPAALKLSAEFNAASGDGNPRDGERNTFDQLYAGNHAKYGQADRIGWRNMRHAGLTAVMAPAKAWKVAAGVHHLALGTTNDAYYGSSGSRVVLNRSATSRAIGLEVDGALTWAVRKDVSVSPGLGVLFAGDFLKETTGSDRLWSPYLVWSVKF